MSMREWLDEGHLAWFVLDVVEAIDTAKLHVLHPNDGPGRPAYNPDMMLALLFYAYLSGVRSSRRIEALCGTDAAFKVIAGGVVPDHSTIARFVVDQEKTIEGCFFEVLRLCAAAGLVSVGTIAIDGTKIAADASLKANRSAQAIEAELERLRVKAKLVITEARAADAAEEALSELFASDRLPADLSTAGGRRARLAAALEFIEAQRAAQHSEAAQKAEAAAEAAAEGRKLAGRKPTDPGQALARAEADLAALHKRIELAVAERAAERAQLETQARLEGRRLRGPEPDGIRRREKRWIEQAEADVAQAQEAAEAAGEGPKVTANVTDLDSRIMKTAKGWVQGYNGQASVNENQVVVACLLSQDPNDVRLYQPMVTATEQALSKAGITNTIGTVLADAGYWSEDNATAEGPDRLIATLKDWKQRKAAQQMGTTSGPPPADATVLEAMEHRLRTPQGAHAYAQRSHTVEPVFGDTKTNRGFSSFRRRGLSAAASEWALINTVHNLAKLHRHNQLRPGLA